MPQIDDLSSVSIDALKDIQNWQSRYRTITQWGTLITPKPDLRIEDNLVRGCEVNAWLTCEAQLSGEFIFFFDSESRVINGLGVLVLSQIQGKDKTNIEVLDWVAIFSELGLSKHLTPSRSNGLREVVNRVYLLVGLPKPF